MERAIARNRVRQTKGGVVFVVIFYLVSVLQSNVNSTKAGLYLLFSLGLVFC